PERHVSTGSAYRQPPKGCSPARSRTQAILALRAPSPFKVELTILTSHAVHAEACASLHGSCEPANVEYDLHASPTAHRQAIDKTPTLSACRLITSSSRRNPLRAQPRSDCVHYVGVGLAGRPCRSGDGLFHRGRASQVVIHARDRLQRPLPRMKAVEDRGEIRMIADGGDEVGQAVDDQNRRADLLPLRGWVDRSPLPHERYRRGIVDVLAARRDLLDQLLHRLLLDQQAMIAKLVFAQPAT